MKNLFSWDFPKEKKRHSSTNSYEIKERTFFYCFFTGLNSQDHLDSLVCRPAGVHLPSIVVGENS